MNFKFPFLPAIVMLLAFAFLSESCKKEQSQPSCEPTLLPVVFVHGYLSSGDIYANMYMRFSSNNYCDEQLQVFNWNTGISTVIALPHLDALINRTLEATGAAKVALVGHGTGGGLCYAYLSDAVHAAKVARYVHLGSAPQSGAAGPQGAIPTLNLYSTNDLVMAGADIPGASNMQFTGMDHYQVVSAPETFAEVYAFFNSGKRPRTTEIEPSDDLLVSGLIVSLGENKRYGSANIHVYEVNPGDGRRRNTHPDTILTTGNGGVWGPWKAKPGAFYEFHVIGPSSPDVIPIIDNNHYYFEPFKRSNPLVYLRQFLEPGTLGRSLLGNIFFAPSTQSPVVVFSNSQAVIYPRDMFRIDGNLLSTAQLTPAPKNIVTMFLYDDGDQQTSGTIHPSFQALQTFITGIDYFLPIAEPASSRLELNGRTLFVPKWDDSGVSVAIFN